MRDAFATLVCAIVIGIAPACAGACGGTMRGVPRAMHPYESTHDVRPYGAVRVDGLELWQATPTNLCCDMESTIVVVGLDARGDEVPTREILRRLAPRTADAWVRPISDLVLHRPYAALVPGDAFLSSSFVTPAEATLVRPPALEGTTLTFFVAEGSMHPQLLRLRVDVRTGEVERAFTRALVAPPPEDPDVVTRRELASPNTAAVRLALAAIPADRLDGVVDAIAEVAERASDRDVRMLALARLREARAPGATAVLGAIVTNDEDREIRLAAAMALAAIASEDAIRFVRDAAASRSVEEASQLYGVLRAAGVR